MANDEERIPDYIITADFLNLGHNRWWEYYNAATRQCDTRIECSEEGQKLHVKITIGDRLTEQLVEATRVDVNGQELPAYRALSSIIPGGIKLTWTGETQTPMPWKVEQSVTATSREGPPPTGYPVTTKVTLEQVGMLEPRFALPEPDEPPELYPPGTEFWSIDLKQVIKDSRLGTEYARGIARFALGIGLVVADGANFGTYFRLRLVDWWGRHEDQ